MNASTDKWGEPVFINPALYYGVTNDISVGIRHFTGLCVSGEANGCTKVYDDVAADSIWSLARASGFQLALGVGLDVFRISDPTLIAAEGRIEVKWGTGPFAVVFTPTFTAGLTNRDDTSPHMIGLAQQSVGNRESIAIPLQLQVQVVPAVAASGASRWPDRSTHPREASATRIRFPSASEPRRRSRTDSTCARR